MSGMINANTFSHGNIMLLSNYKECKHIHLCLLGLPPPLSYSIGTSNSKVTYIWCIQLHQVLFCACLNPLCAQNKVHYSLADICLAILYCKVTSTQNITAYRVHYNRQPSAIFSSKCCNGCSLFSATRQTANRLQSIAYIDNHLHFRYSSTCSIVNITNVGRTSILVLPKKTKWPLHWIYYASNAYILAKTQTFSCMKADLRTTTDGKAS